ncbi:MAG TPA: hypothetical protein VFH36_16050, partial [Acidimicrobiales bacterium]|nr:hypothetical protein [Acidimicrobiales bacterium]
MPLAACIQLSTVAAGPHRHLPTRGLALADDLGDGVVAVVEHLAQQEHGPLLRRQALQQDEERERQRVRHLRVGGGIVHTAGHHRLRQPFADVGLPSHLRRAEPVDAEPGDDGGQVGLGHL